jgi:hypothetical protein
MPIGDYRFTFLVPVLLANGPEFVKEQKRDSLFPQELKKKAIVLTRAQESGGQQVYCILRNKFIVRKMAFSLSAAKLFF